MFNTTTTTPPTRINVCKAGPAGSYSFTVSQTGGRGGTLLAGAAFQLQAGQCVDVWEALPDPPSSDPLVDVSITEVGLPSGIQFDSVVGTSAVSGKVLSTNPGVTVQVNFYHDARLTWYNSETPPSFVGCTPGYWKTHPSRWPAPYTTGTQFSAVFENAFPGMTLLQVASLGGGGLNALGRHTVAGLLSAQSGINYPMTAQQVIDAFNAVFPGGDYASLQGRLAAFNEANCPLN